MRLTAPGLLCLLLLTAAPWGAQAQDSGLSSALFEKVDAYAQRQLRTGKHAGFSIAIEQGGELLLAGGWGLAHVELEVPATAETVYRIGSVTKQFTAAAILLQVERGEISLDAKVVDYLPDFDVQGHDLRIHHLLNHTSGIKSYTGLPEFWERVDHRFSHQEMMALVEAHPFDFAPGERFLYNNSAYYLLGVILEELRDESYEQFLREEFFEPLEMDHSCYGWGRPIMKGRASGYDVEDDQLVNCATMSMSAPGAAGALCSTVGDLVRWNRGIVEWAVVAAESYEQMTTPGSLNDGSTLEYGYGLSIGKTAGGRQMISHGGGIFGFASNLVYLPDEDLCVAILTNCTAAQPGAMTRKVLDAYFDLRRPAP